MTTSAEAGVALSDSSEQAPRKDTVYIVGFAPTWIQTPWTDDADFWGMNALHKVAGERPWTAWFQLHDIDKHHPEDKEEHIAWLSSQKFPVFMWAEHAEKYALPNGVIYPRKQVIDEFGGYFTNTVSWMIAVAVLSGYKKIGVYGVDMAQDTEYGHQRPSCEFLLGIAAGRGIEIDIPPTSDLLKTPFLYGLEDGSIMRQKYDARLKELIERRQDLERQRNAVHEAFLQVVGAIEDCQYWLRAWSQEEAKAQ